MDFKTNLFTSSLLASLISVAAFAQQGGVDGEQWYQVEMVVFASNQPNAGLDEQWPDELGLKYPDKLVTLSNTLQTIPSTDALASLDQASTSFMAEMADAEASAIPKAMAAPLKAFSVLADENLQLREAAQKIAGQYDYRQLFHKAWRQTINDRDNATSIVITGGEAYDQHFELEGSIKISLERYLHINTDLWLNQFVSKTGQSQPSLHLLPPVPTQIDESNASEQEIPFYQTPNSFNAGNIDPATGELISNNTALPGYQLPPQTDPLSASEQQLQLQLALLEDSQYAVEQTIVMRQHRRMRSTELHYIDHPMFGVLIRIDPYNPYDNITPEGESE